MATVRAYYSRVWQEIEAGASTLRESAVAA
jgi:hypothetical protein